MLLKLLIYRLLPVALLRLCRGRKCLKMAVCILLAVGVLCYGAACREILKQEQWQGMICLVLAMLPQGIVYGFSVWMLVRCVWSAWSERVWRRIHCLAMLGIVLGILMEAYINPYILRFFFEFFK